MKHRNLLFAAVGDLLRRPLRSALITACLAAILLPILTGVAVSQGLKRHSQVAVAEGADLYVASDLLGGEGPLFMAAGEGLSQQEGVARIAPRVVGRAYFANQLISVVGLERDGLAGLKALVQGDIPRQKGDVLLGAHLAEHFGVDPGVRFTLPANSGKVFRRSGTLSPSCLWGADIMIMELADANEFFRTPGMCTQLLVTIGPGGARLEGVPGLKVTDRAQIQDMVNSAYGHTGGIFIVFFSIGLALGIPAFLVTSGFGLRELHQEIGVMKSIGWETRDIVEKVFLGNLLISLVAVALSLLLSMFWTKLLNGVFLAQFFVSEVGLVPEADIPSQYLVTHAVTALGIALALTLVGSLSCTWAKARRTPAGLMR